LNFFVFCFQAEDGIRDRNVTGVQTCALPISFATILVVWHGVKSALSSASGKPFFEFDSFAALLLTVSFGFGMANYYSNPIPGIGTGFHNLVTDEAQFLANKINQTELQTVEERIADFEVRMDSPGVTDILGTI